MESADEPRRRSSRRLTQSSPSQRVIAAARVAPKRRRLGPLAAIAALVVGVGSAAAYVSMHAGGATAALAAFAPERTVLWVEARKPKATYEAWKETSRSSSYRSLLGSNTYAEARKPWDELVAKAARGELGFVKELGLPVDERLVELFFGEDVAWGVLPPRDDAAPATFLYATEVDAAGLAHDLALQGDLAAVWDKVTRALGPTTGESYKGWAIHTDEEDGVKTYAALVRTVIVASDDLDTLKEALDAKAGEKPSLAGKKLFADEVRRLPASAASAWVDLAFARSADKVAASLRAWKSDVDARVFTALASDLGPLDAVALGVSFEGGDLLAPHVVASRREDEVFRDTKAHDPLLLASPTAPLVFRGRDLATAASRLVGGPLGQALAKGGAGEWWRQALERPADSLVFANEKNADHDLTFEMQLATRLGAALADELVGEDALLSLEITKPARERELPIDTCAVLRSHALVRLATDLVSGYAHSKEGQPLFERSAEAIGRDRARRAPPRFEVVAHGDTKIYGLGDEMVGVYWAQAGGSLLVGSKRATLEAALDRAAKDAVTPEAVKPTGPLAKLPADWSLAMWGDMARYQRASREVISKGQPDPIGDWFAEQQAAGEMAVTATVPPDGRSIGWRSFQEWGPSKLKAFFKPSGGEPRVWKALPAESIASMTFEIDAKAFYDFVLSGVRAVQGDESVKELEADAREVLGRDLEPALVRPLGSSHGVSIVPQDRLPSESSGVTRDLAAVPALVLALELEDSAGYEDMLVKLAKKMIAKANETARRREEDLAQQTGQSIVRGKRADLAASWHGDATFYRFVLPDEDAVRDSVGDGFAPCFAVKKGWLLVATSEPALAKAFAAAPGRDLASSSELSRLLGDQPRAASCVSHFSFAALLSQLEANSELIALKAAPPPRSIGKSPPPPTVPVLDRSSQTPDEMERLIADYRARSRAWQRDVGLYRQRLADWREGAAAENADVVLRFLRGLRPLGGYAGTSRATPEGIDATGCWRFDLPASDR